MAQTNMEGIVTLAPDVIRVSKQIEKGTYQIRSNARMERACSLFLNLKANLHTLGAYIQSVRDRHKTELAPYLKDQTRYETLLSRCADMLIAYRKSQETEHEQQQTRLNALYQERLHRARKAGKDPNTVMGPALLPVLPKSTAIEDRGQVIVATHYTFTIPGVDDPSTLRMDDPLAKDIPAEYFLLDPPACHADELWPQALPKSWFVFDTTKANREAKASRGAQIIPGVEIVAEPILVGQLVKHE